MTIAAEWVTPIVVALVGAFVSIIVARSNRKASSEQALINQLQEEQRFNRERVDALETKIANFEVAQRVSLNYVHLLRNHIIEGMPPPPPDFPEGMLR